MLELRIVKRVPTGIHIKEDVWQYLCEISFGEYNTTLQLFKEEEDFWTALEEYDSDLHAKLWQLCLYNGGKIEVAEEE